MRKKRQQVEPSYVPPDGYWWFRNYIPLRGGHYNREWRIAQVKEGRVLVLGYSTWLDPACDLLRLAMWGAEIVPPPIGASDKPALTRQGSRRRNRCQRKEPELPAPALQLAPQQFRDVAEGIVRAFVETSGDLWIQYGRHPDKLVELVEEVAGVLERAFGAG